jgi:hypothetical protein
MLASIALDWLNVYPINNPNIIDVTWKSVKPSPLAPLPQERGTRK